jgi:hypothetical protein
MRYHWFRQCRLFVGSGLVEAGCKSVIGHRLKRAGMHWTVNGADAITALRAYRDLAAGTSPRKGRRRVSGVTPPRAPVPGDGQVASAGA